MAKREHMSERDPERERWISARSSELRTAEVDVEVDERAKEMVDTVTGRLQGWRWSYKIGISAGSAVGSWTVQMPIDSWAAQLVDAWMASDHQDATVQDGVLILKGPMACWSFSRLVQACGRVHYPAPRAVTLAKATDTDTREIVVDVVPEDDAGAEDQGWLDAQAGGGDDASGDGPEPPPAQTYPVGGGDDWREHQN